MKLCVFTSATINRIPNARTLARSLKSFHPDAHFSLLVSEPVPKGLDIAFAEFDDITDIDSIEVPGKYSWLFKRTADEAGDAIAGIFAQCLLRRENCDVLLYLSSQMTVLSPLTPLLAKLQQASILLLPRHSGPLGVSKSFETELELLDSGLYESSCIAIKKSTTGEAFTSWLTNRLTHDTPGQLFCPYSKWLSAVPSLFEGVELVSDSESKILQRHVSDAANHANNSWRYDCFDNSDRVRREHRIIYALRDDLQERYPSPFATDEPDSFYTWLITHHDELEVIPANTDSLAKAFYGVLRRKLNFAGLQKFKLAEQFNRKNNLELAVKNAHKQQLLLAEKLAAAKSPINERRLPNQNTASPDKLINQLNGQLSERQLQLADITSRKSWKLLRLLRRIETKCRTGGESLLAISCLFVYWTFTFQLFQRLKDYRIVKYAFSTGALFDPNLYWSQVPSRGRSGAQAAAFHYVFQGGARKGIKPCHLFDTAFYTQTNPDVAFSDTNPLSHFLSTGAKELRNPGRLFNASYYLTNNPCDPKASQNPLLHYIKVGAEQGFRPCALFDPAYYVQSNPDASSAGVTALEHFIAIGAPAGSNPHPLFDTAYYLKANPELTETGENALEHFLRVGSQRGRKPHRLFDTEYYAKNTPGFDASLYTALEHFIAFGTIEKAKPNPIFDTSYYLETYKDVAATGVNPLIHYALGGASEGRKAHKLFDSAYYLRNYPDIAQAGLNPLAHFLETGAREGRKPNALFDPAYYLRSNPDLEAAGVNPLVHFIEDGANQGRKPNFLFDIDYYRARIKDSEDLKLNPLEHFMQSGASEELNPHPLFDTHFYIEQNPEVKAAAQNPLAHFLEMGSKECRNPNPYFDAVYYLREYPDVAEGNLNPFSHYVLIGDKEGRSTCAWFDSAYYQEHNPNVAKSGINSLAHYIAGGIFEGRKPHPYFDPDYYAEQYADVRTSGLSPLLHYIRIGAPAGRSAIPPHLGTHPPYSSTNKTLTKKASLPLAPSADDWEKLFQSKPHADLKADAEVDVIIPVYRGYDATLACIYNVLNASVRLPHEVIVINDCSPEPDLVSELQKLAQRGFFTLLQNETNLGFVGTVNRGMSQHGDRDVVLLNSDAFVYGDWLDRLHWSINTEARLGTLTPFTNNDPTFCTYPRFDAENNTQLEIDYAQLDRIFAEVNANQLIEIPTAVGFCMYIRRDCLNEVGSFDEEAFGKGNGEENDFSLRAMAKGWKNMLAGNVFVRHIGAVSFLAEKSTALKHSAAILKARYPKYFPSVKEFCKADPIKPLRRRVDIARIKRDADKPAVLFVTHDRGGGIERHLRELVSHWQEVGFQPLIMRSDKKFNDMVHILDPQIPETPNLTIRDFSQHVDEAVDTLKTLNVKHIHVHHMPHLVGRVQRAPLPVQEIARRLNLSYDLTVHDYTPICPRINLIDESGSYCGEPDVKVCEKCVAESGSPFGVVPVKAWRQAYDSILSNARRVFVPNADVSERLKKYFPQAAFAVRPHPEEFSDRLPAPQVPQAKACPLRVAVLGAIGPHKGAKVLLDCVADAQERNLPIEFVLFGYASNEVELRQFPGITITGPYNDVAIYDLLEKYRCHISFFPAVWPETFSYTLSIAMKANLYPVAFDFGAISQRLKELQWGELLPLELISKADQLNDRLLALNATPLTSLIPDSARRTLYPNFLQDYYELDTTAKADLAPVQMEPLPAGAHIIASAAVSNSSG